MQMPPGADIAFVVNLTKIGAYLAIAYAALKILRPMNEFLADLRVIRAEHRMLIEDLWTRHPEKKDDFYIAMDREFQSNKQKSLFATSGK